MATVAIITMDALVFASWLFLVSVGLTVIYGVLRILNVAHGSLYAFGAFVGATMVAVYRGYDVFFPGSYLVLVAAAVVVGVLAAVLLERGVLRWLYGQHEAMQLVSTFALFLILDDAVRLIWGGGVGQPFELLWLPGTFTVGGISYDRYKLIVMGLVVVIGVLLWVLFTRTRFGKLVKAVIADPEMSLAMGVNLPRVYVVTFAIGAAVAALGGAFTAPTIAVVPGIGVNVIVLAFAVVVIGGLGSLPGAALGSLIVGIVRTIIVHSDNPTISALELVAVYLVMVAVLIFRPHGLFAREEARRI